MSVQSDYALDLSVGTPGQIADIGVNAQEIISRACETSGGIGYGKVVSFGTNKEKECVIGGDGTGIGVSVRNVNNDEYEQYDAVDIMRKGYIWAVVATAAVAGTALHYDDTTGIIDSGAASTGETAMTNCELVTTVASNGDLGLIRVDM